MIALPSRAALDAVLDQPLITNEQVAAKLAHAKVRLHEVGNDADLRARIVAAGCRLNDTSGNWHGIRVALRNHLHPPAGTTNVDARVRRMVERAYAADGLTPPADPTDTACED